MHPLTANCLTAAALSARGVLPGADNNHRANNNANRWWARA